MLVDMSVLRLRHPANALMTSSIHPTGDTSHTRTTTQNIPPRRESWLVYTIPSGAQTSIHISQDKRVLVITQDGRTITGELKGFDQTTNIILSDSVERVYSSDEPMEEVPLGLYIVRGDHISVIGELDVEADAKIDWSSIRAEPLDEIRH
ncbi:uncharacterized protein PGTG_20884 [Puccinia graminis f. sp. tritici CRL 75-36-700-3]|uniref:LSM2-LSM8 complex subunit LSM8 n=1 Tax=Puccinia graminis f. sp. tritici (strain CRL 75-36-700-3 / race SCCL) TaxID=418459 RepID=H6QPF4_PUCGT|nr:uncharacterized protein PGTG_20884 [Puccinia graminis f. sp. tritici CRL 75-36-700-3]EHS63902.1 hypothetical protein PGTG_20884 [Puccinia graminis f. sp. tritici CRL 75-36-700-3]